jgi:hypothetical protein
MAPPAPAQAPLLGPAITPCAACRALAASPPARSTTRRTPRRSLCLRGKARVGSARLFHGQGGPTARAPVGAVVGEEVQNGRRPGGASRCSSPPQPRGCLTAPGADPPISSKRSACFPSSPSLMVSLRAGPGPRGGGGLGGGAQATLGLRARMPAGSPPLTRPRNPPARTATKPQNSRQGPRCAVRFI